MAAAQICPIALIAIIIQKFTAFSHVRIFFEVAFQVCWVILSFFLDFHNLIKLELIFAFLIEIDLTRIKWLSVPSSCLLLYCLEISVRLCIDSIDQIEFHLHKVVPAFSRTVHRTEFLILYALFRLLVLWWLINLDTLLDHFCRQDFIAKFLSKLVKLLFVAMLQV